MLFSVKIFFFISIISVISITYITSPNELKYQSKYPIRDKPIFSHAPPCYTINLNSNYTDTWREIITDKKEILKNLVSSIQKLLVPKLFDYIPYSWIEAYDSEIAKEAKAIADLADIKVGTVFLLNFLYESSAFCTAILAQSVNEEVIHSWNMDYQNFVEFLTNLTYQANFYKDGQLIMRGNGYAGMIGLVAGEKMGYFGLSINQRNTLDRSYITNWIRGLSSNLYYFLWKKYSNTPYIVKKILLEAQTFEDVLKMTNDCQLVSPVYFVISGNEPNQGIILSKGRESIDEITKLNVDNGTWFIAHTNYDRSVKDPLEDNRRTAAEI